MKRSFDIIFSFFGLILLSPILIFAVLVIIFSDFEHPLFFQDRIGQFGKPFRLVKFRSMTVDKSSSKGSFDAGNRSRITKIGRIIRKTKIDELPQLWNVLIGEMSIVGPRPEVAKWVTTFPERWSVVHQVKPGITDNASIEFRNEEDLLADSNDPELTYREVILPRKLTLYEQYVKEASFFTDLKIILKTIYTVVLH